MCSLSHMTLEHARRMPGYSGRPHSAEGIQALQLHGVVSITDAPLLTLKP